MTSNPNKKRLVKCSLCLKFDEEKKLKTVIVPLRKWKLCKKCYTQYALNRINDYASGIAGCGKIQSR